VTNGDRGDTKSALCDPGVWPPRINAERLVSAAGFTAGTNCAPRFSHSGSNKNCVQAKGAFIWPVSERVSAVSAPQVAH